MTADAEKPHTKLGCDALTTDTRLFFCYCCGVHIQERYCALCGSRACWRCLEWEYECRRLGDDWCLKRHVPLRVCPHPDDPFADVAEDRPVPIRPPRQPRRPE